jgi:hypothetical protein
MAHEYNNNSSQSYTKYCLVRHTLSILSLVCSPVQWLTFPSLFVPKLSLCLSYSSSQLTPTQLLLSQKDSLWTESLYTTQEGLSSQLNSVQ